MEWTRVLLVELAVDVGRSGPKNPEFPEEFRLASGAPEDAGVMISAIVEGGPAEAAGLELGDVVYDVDGMPVASAADLTRLLAVAGVENTIELTLMRNGTEIVVEAVVQEEPDRRR